MVYPFIDRNFWPNRVLERDGGVIIVLLLFVLLMREMENEGSSEDKNSFFARNSVSAFMFAVGSVFRFQLSFFSLTRCSITLSI